MFRSIPRELKTAAKLSSKTFLVCFVCWALHYEFIRRTCWLPGMRNRERLMEELATIAKTENVQTNVQD